MPSLTPSAQFSCSADDVAAAVTQVLRQSKRPNPVYELAGPRVYSYEELVRTVARSAGLRRVLMPAPFSFWGALAGLAEILPHPPHPQPGRVYTDRHYGLRQLAGIRQARNFAAFARRRTRSNAQSKSNDRIPIAYTEGARARCLICRWTRCGACWRNKSQLR